MERIVIVNSKQAKQNLEDLLKTKSLKDILKERTVIIIEEFSAKFLDTKEEELNKIKETLLYLGENPQVKQYGKFKIYIWFLNAIKFIWLERWLLWTK